MSAISPTLSAAASPIVEETSCFGNIGSCILGSSSSLLGRVDLNLRNVALLAGIAVAVAGAVITYIAGNLYLAAHFAFCAGVLSYSFIAMKDYELIGELSSTVDRVKTQYLQLERTHHDVAVTSANLAETNTNLTTRNTEFQERVANLETTNGELQTTNGELQTTNGELQTTNGELQATNGRLEETRAGLQARVEDLDKTKAGLEETKGALEQRVGELQRQLGSLETIRARLESDTNRLTARLDMIENGDEIYKENLRNIAETTAQQQTARDELVKIQAQLAIVQGLLATEVTKFTAQNDRLAAYTAAQAAAATPRSPPPSPPSATSGGSSTGAGSSTPQPASGFFNRIAGAVTGPPKTPQPADLV